MVRSIENPRVGGSIPPRGTIFFENVYKIHKRLQICKITSCHTRDTIFCALKRLIFLNFSLFVTLIIISSNSYAGFQTGQSFYEIREDTHSSAQHKTSYIMGL